MFARITEIQKDGQELQYVNERFEYFHHYWTLFFLNKRKEKSESRRVRILLTPNYLFLEKSTLESHRSLFIKINKQLHHNYPKAKDKLEYLFKDHPYFSATNNILIRRNQKLANKVTSINQVLLTASGNAFRKERPQEKQQITENFKSLESQLFHRYPYEKRLSNHLYKVLSRNKPLTYQDKEDIKFLVNAFIVEFYHYGYSEDYIEKVPNIIILREPPVEYFPYDKRLSDFANDRNAYKQYAEEENKKMNCKKMLNGLSKLLNARKYTGYVIFKIEGIRIEESIQLQGVEFYNPQIEQKVSKREYISDEPELFIQEKTADESNPDKANQASTCNAIVKVTFLSPDRLIQYQTIMEAFRRVESSTTILENILNRYANLPHRRISLNLQMKKSILIYDSNRRPAYGTEIFDKISDKLYDIKSLGQQEEKWVNIELEFFNLANHNFDLGRRIIALIRQQKKFENDSSSFNFRDLWVTWEGMFEDKSPGEKKETFQAVALDAIKIFLSTNFLPRIKNILKGGLKSHYFIELEGEHSYLLKDQELDKLGLGKEKGEYVKARKFAKNYQDVFKFLDFLLLREIIDRVDVFVSDPNQYYSRVKEWIYNTIDEVYFERNLEVHNNEETDSSRFKLQGDFLEISSITMHEILRNINRNTKSDIKKVFDRMENKANMI